MARSSEKAMTALARWRAAFVDKVQETTKRPVIASECTSLKDSMFYRRQVVHDISRKIAQIQNPSLGEYKLRDLNDDINKLIREKKHWDEHIKNLGGPDFEAEAPKMLEKEGREVPGNKGYRYYGAARDLPGVRELFEEEPQQIARKSRGELMKLVDVCYYGACDEDDGIIVPMEAAYELESIARKTAEWKTRREMGSKPAYTVKSDLDGEEIDEIDEDNADTKNIYDVGENPADIELMRFYEGIEHVEVSASKECSVAEKLVALIGGNEDELKSEDDVTTYKSMSSLGAVKRAFVAHVPVYSQDEVEAALVAKRKREILEKYMSDDLLASMTETGEILGLEDSTDCTSDQKLKNNGDSNQEEVEDE